MLSLQRQHRLLQHFLTIAQLQRLQELEQFEQEVSRPNWINNNDRRKTCKGFQTDTDKEVVVVYRFCRKFDIKHTTLQIKLAEYQTLFAKRL